MNATKLTCRITEEIMGNGEKNGWFRLDPPQELAERRVVPPQWYRSRAEAEAEVERNGWEQS